MLRARLSWFCVLAVILFSSSSAAQASYMQTVLNDGASMYYRLGENGGTTAYDSANGAGAPGYGAQDATAGTGVALGAVSGALVGDANTAATFDGSQSGHISVAYDPAFNPDNSIPFTMEAWVKTTSNGLQTIAGHYNGPSAIGYFFALNGTAGNEHPYVQLENENDNAYAYQVGTGSSLDDGKWHYVVAAHVAGNTSASLSVFVDGSQVSTTPGDHGTISDIENFEPFLIGARESGSPGQVNPFTGSLDEVAYYYGIALDANTIHAHYLAGTVPEPSAIILLGTGMLGLLAYAWRKRR